MYETILVPIDLSHKERVAQMLTVARQFAGANSRIILVNVIEEIPPYIAAQLPEGTFESSLGLAVEEMKTIASEAGLKAEIEVRSGHPASSILEIAEEKGVDLIVIASHRPGWENYLIGSTAGRVVRHAKCAVHVLR